MANQNLEEYIKKILQLQEKQENFSDIDLKEIAENLGISYSMIEQAHQNYNQKGIIFLKYQNFDDALVEFEQANILKPNQTEVLFGIATCFAGKFEQTKRTEDKEKAIEIAKKCLNINANFEKAAFLISYLKQDVKPTPHNHNPKQSNPVGQFIFVIGIFLLFFSVGILFLVLSPSQKYKPKNSFATKDKIILARNQVFSESIVATGSKGSVLWYITYTQRTENGTFLRTYEVQIIDIQSKKLLQTQTLAENINFIKTPFKDFIFLDNDKIYAEYIDENENKTIVAWNIYSGEIVENKQSFEKKFPIIKESIGSMEFDFGSKYWIKITTKNGKIFYHSPKFQMFFSIEEYKKINQDYTKKEHFLTKSCWGKNKNQGATELIFYQEKVRPFSLYPYDSKYLHSHHTLAFLQNNPANFQNIQISKEKFLDPVLIHGNENIALVRSVSEIGSEGKSVFSLIEAKTGNIRWQIKKEEVENSVLSAFFKLKGNLEAYVAEGKKIVLYSKYIPFQKKVAHACVVEIDLKDGKILTEYCTQ